MRIETLENFIAISREESISLAAEKMHISQPALSQQLASMEKELGAKLFVRDTRKLKLTDAGMIVQRKAAEILSLYQEMKTDLTGENIEGKIRIGCGELASMDMLSDAIAAFSEIHPRVSFHLISMNADKSVEMMDHGQLELALVMEPIFFEKYNFMRFPVEEEWVCCMKQDDPLVHKEYITPKDLAGSRIILPYREGAANIVLSWFGEYAATLKVAGSSSFYSNAAVMVKKGMGRAIYIKRQIPYPSDDDVVCCRLEPRIKVLSSLIWDKQYQSTEVRKFIEFLIGFLNK
ncbi:MAG: LysR family transcriptional regulator [Clostridia bacterium]|nr:LysR family transcriptional regulator [Clostridia bacterium]